MPARCTRWPALTRCRLFDLRDAFLADDDLPGCLCRDGMHPPMKKGSG